MANSALSRLSRDFFNRRILIFGLGLLGRGLGDARFFSELGAKVKVTDLKTENQLQSSLTQLAGLPVSFTLGTHLQTDIDWADIIIRNAAVPWHHPLLDYARSLGKPVYMDDQLFVQYAGIHTIGITGTRGKTTTTHLIYELLSRLGHRQVLLGGNIQGIATLPLIKHIRSPETIAVLELSSWQLQGFASVKLSPNLAVFTNLYPDHLNTYTSLTSYYRDKQNLTRFQSSSDYVFFNQAQRGLFQLWADQTQAQAHWYSHKDLPQHLTLKLLGQHNRENAAAAYAVARHYQLPNQETLHILSDFSGLPYRLQLIKSYQGIDIYNDSTSTTPTATIKALQSFDCPIILILGGTDKNLPVSDLIATVNAKADHLILIEGNGTDRIKHSLNSQKILLTTDSLHQAVSTALDIAKKGDVILFSPGFTSFGLFNNEYDRGEKFNQALRQIL